MANADQTMEETPERVKEMFIHNGVSLSKAPAVYITYMNTIGILYVVEYVKDSTVVRTVEWRPNDITVDSDVQAPEWEVVTTVERRERTLSGCQSGDGSGRSKYLKINLQDIGSFRCSQQYTKLSFMDGAGETIFVFTFQSNCQRLVALLRTVLKATPSRRNKNLFVILPPMDDPDAQRLNKSFAELRLFSDEVPGNVWNLVKNFPHKPYETTLEAFSKITDIVYRGPDQLRDSEVNILNKSLDAIENTATVQGHDEYELITHTARCKLPARRDCPRGLPLSQEQWDALHHRDGSVEDAEMIKLLIFQGGVCPELRAQVWKFLLDYADWEQSTTERHADIRQKRDDYFIIKLQWMSMTLVQENNFSDYRERKSLIQKDVNRTDRNLAFFSGDNNPNVQLLNDILMTYVMYNFDLGYVQGMSDLLAPILFLLQNEADAFWCFVGFMNKICSNFDIDQAGMKEQLQHLHTLLAFVDPDLATYLDRHDSGNMFFCFRWLLVWFKRELEYDDVMYLWEVLWTGLPCQNFHLLLCIAILDGEKKTFIENNFGFTEILKHVNDLSGDIDVATTISQAESIYHQIIEADHLTDAVRLILGLPLVGNSACNNSKEGSPSTDHPSSPEGFSNCEALYERGMNQAYI